MSRVRVRGWWLVSLLALAMMAMPWPSGLIEAVYSRRLYPLLQRMVTGASNQVGWAIIDVLLVAAVGVGHGPLDVGIPVLYGREDVNSGSDMDLEIPCPELLQR